MLQKCLAGHCFLQIHNLLTQACKQLCSINFNGCKILYISIYRMTIYLYLYLQLYTYNTLVKSNNHPLTIYQNKNQSPTLNNKHMLELGSCPVLFCIYWYLKEQMYYIQRRKTLLKQIDYKEIFLALSIYLQQQGYLIKYSLERFYSLYGENKTSNRKHPQRSGFCKSVEPYPTVEAPYNSSIYF